MDPELSQCFFQKFLNEEAPPHFQPILQIIEAREMHGQNQYRVRMSDGIFSYAGCIIGQPLYRRFNSDQLTSHNGIIQVTNWKRTPTQGKSMFSVIDYNVITLDFPVIGNPQPHTGNPVDYHGHMQALPQQMQQIQNPDVNQGQSRSNPSMSDPENALGSSAKRGRAASPSNESRQPLSKRQPDTGGMANVVPIGYITPYCNKWRICGIVSGKDPQIKEINNARGNFKVFGFILTDKDGSSIRVSAFGETADRVFPIVQNGGVYFVGGGGRPGSVKAANRQFNNTGHDYEILLDRDSEVTYCEHHFEAPKMRFKPVPLTNVPQRVNECVDVQAVVDRVGEVAQITTRKDQKQLDKRDVYLVDKTATEIRLTLWGDEAMKFSVKPGTVLGVKGAFVKEFNGGFTISTGSSSQLIENPDNAYSQDLYTWYRNQRKHQEIMSLSAGSDSSGVFERDFRFIAPIMQQQGIAQENDKGQYFYVKAMINTVKSEQALYQACPKQGCKKKVSADNGRFRCEKCNEEFDSYVSRIMLQVELADFTGTVWVTLFDEIATNLLGIKTTDLAQLQREDHTAYEAVFNKIRFHDFLFRVRVRSETYNDQQQMRWSVNDVKPMPYDKLKQLYRNALLELAPHGHQQKQAENANDSFYN